MLCIIKRQSDDSEVFRTMEINTLDELYKLAKNNNSNITVRVSPKKSTYVELYIKDGYRKTEIKDIVAIRIDERRRNTIGMYDRFITKGKDE